MASSFDESEMKEIELDVERVDAKKVSDSKEIAFSGESTYTHNDEETMSCKNTDSNSCMVQPEDGTENIEAQFHEEKQESAISHEVVLYSFRILNNIIFESQAKNFRLEKDSKRSLF